MDAETRKRPSPSEDDQPLEKRRRISILDALGSPETAEGPTYASEIVTSGELAKKGLRRSIGLALEKVGFDSAEPQALESFALTVETYLASLVEDVRFLATFARRSHPIPTDFENSLKRFNLSLSSLKPHLRPPVPKAKRIPASIELELEDETVVVLPVLGEELSGAADKESKTYIPPSFPPFPSIHTYKYTPEDVEAVTVSEDWGALNPDTQSQSLPGRPSRPQSQTRPLAPHEIPRGDPKKLREAAAKEAKAGEEALRRLMRASKIAKQKEVWTTAQREPARKDRYGLWESAMRESIDEDGQSKSKDALPAIIHAATGRFEIADHSMIVNTESGAYRKDVSRPGARKTATSEMLMGRG